jgi:SHS2 domain-containing protein
LFSNAALALAALAVDLDAAEPRQCFPLAAAGEDEAALLVNWLSEVLYHLDGRRLVLCRFQVDEVEAGAVQGKAWGEPWDPARHVARRVIKGVTYHQLRIGKDESGWIAEVFLDI